MVAQLGFFTVSQSSRRGFWRGEATDVIESALRSQRRIVLLTVFVNLLSSSFLLVLLGDGPLPATAVDYVAQSLMVVALVALLAWVWMDERQPILRPAMVTGFIVATMILLRLGYSAFGRGWGGDLATVLPPMLGYSPAVIVFFFAVTSVRYAHRLAQSYILISGILMLFYVIFHAEQLGHSPRMTEAVQEFLFVNPIIYLLMIIAVEVQTRLREQRSLRRVAGAPNGAERSALLDPGTSALNWKGFRTIVSEAAVGEQRDYRNVAMALIDVGHLRHVNAKRDPRVLLEQEFIARSFVAQVREAFGDDTVVGRLTPSRFALAWPSKALVEVLDPATDFVATQNTGVTDPAERICMGLAGWRPGETMVSVLQRCEEQMRKVDMLDSMGLGFDANDTLA